MADTAVAITAGSGTNIDTRTEGTNSNHRQVIVIGDPATNAGVAPVDATSGLSVNVTNASLTVASHAVTNAGTFATQNTPARAASSAITTQTDQASNATLLASNSSRRAAIIVNDSTEILYIKYGATATSTDWTYRLQAGETLREEMYSGRIDGIWANNASGTARITELT